MDALVLRCKCKIQPKEDECARRGKACARRCETTIGFAKQYSLASGFSTRWLLQEPYALNKRGEGTICQRGPP